ncbi:hypothetical protein ABPG75_012901 [Micractinium tetrahymenae]
MGGGCLAPDDGVFAMEEEEQHTQHRALEGPDTLMQAHLAYLLRPQGDQAALVMRDVELCSLRLSLSSASEQRSPQELAAALAARGHAVRVLRAAGGGQGVAAFRRLRHTFLSVAAAAVGEQDIVVDPHFRCQFVLAAPSPRFAALHRLLPQVFVGGMDQLEHVVEWVTREMHWSFKEAGQALPPWREHAAVMSKWLSATPLPPPGAHQQQDSPASSSPCSSPRAQCCCCCQQGGAADAVAAAAASGCGGGTQPVALSPSSVCQPPAAFGGSRQASATLTASTPSTPVSLASAASLLRQPRISLLSRSLEAAGLPARIQQPRQAPAASWWEPHTITVVRRSA